MLPKMKAHLSGIAGTEKEKPSKVSFHHKQQTSQGLRLKVFPSILHRWNSFSWNDWGGTLGPSAYQALSYHWPMSQWWGTEEEHSVSQTMQLFSRPAPLVTDQPVQGQSCYAMYCILPGTWTPACLPLVAPGSKSRKCLKAILGCGWVTWCRGPYVFGPLIWLSIRLQVLLWNSLCNALAKKWI